MNQIDNKLTLISLQAERSIKSCPTVYSSPTINKLREALHEVRKLITITEKGSSSLANYKKLRQKDIASLRHAVQQQHVDRHCKELAKLNNMVQNGTDAGQNNADRN
jgi:UDP-N-acetylglucosamine transferase subunit ALG13